MLKAARSRTAGQSNVELRKGSLETLPVDDAACDAALLVLALAYVPEPPLVLAEMARVLKPGGRAVVVDLLRHDREAFRLEMGQQCLGFEAVELREMMRDGGFGSAACRVLPPDAGAKGPALILATAERTRRARPRVSEREGERKR